VNAALVYPPPLPLGLEILSCCDGRAFGKHLHDGYVLWLNSESGEQYQVAGTSDILEPGAVSLIEPGVVHSNQPCDASRRHLRSIYFSEAFLSGTLSRKLERRLPVLRTARFENRVLWERLSALHEGILQGADNLRLEEEMLEAFSLLYGHCGVADGMDTGLRDGRLRRLIDFLHENTDAPVTLADLAGLAQCSEHHVIRMFRRHTGLPPHAFLSQLRLERARQLLDAGMTIAEAAAHSGLCDQSHLTRMFKARYGVTPGRYRVQRGLL
jgi:AraC-like DNA-binding protein